MPKFEVGELCEVSTHTAVYTIPPGWHLCEIKPIDNGLFPGCDYVICIFAYQSHIISGYWSTREGLLRKIPKYFDPAEGDIQAEYPKDYSKEVEI